MLRRFPAVLGAAVALALPCPSHAQIRASEQATVSQVVDGTTITVGYYRPSARGRNPLFGKVVKWDERWTPGANWATTLEVDRDVRLNGQPLPKGQYSLWITPRDEATWLLEVSRAARRFHMDRPDTADTQLRLELTPDSAAFLEMLTFSFPTVAGDGALLRMQWGTTSIPLRITVEPTRPARIAADKVTRYVGRYAFTGPDEPNGKTYSMEVVDTPDGLQARGDIVYPNYDPFLGLLPIGEDRFQFVNYKGGKPYEVEVENPIVFQVENGRATGFVVYGADGRVIGEGKRVK